MFRQPFWRDKQLAEYGTVAETCMQTSLTLECSVCSWARWLFIQRISWWSPVHIWLTSHLHYPSSCAEISKLPLAALLAQAVAHDSWRVTTSFPLFLLENEVRCAARSSKTKFSRTEIVCQDVGDTRVRRGPVSLETYSILNSSSPKTHIVISNKWKLYRTNAVLSNLYWMAIYRNSCLCWNTRCCSLINTKCELASSFFLLSSKYRERRQRLCTEYETTDKKRLYCSLFTIVEIFKERFQLNVLKNSPRTTFFRLFHCASSVACACFTLRGSSFLINVFFLLWE